MLDTTHKDYEYSKGTFAHHKKRNCISITNFSSVNGHLINVTKLLQSKMYLQFFFLPFSCQIFLWGHFSQKSGLSMRNLRANQQEKFPKIINKLSSFETTLKTVLWPNYFDRLQFRKLSTRRSLRSTYYNFSKLLVLHYSISTPGLLRALVRQGRAVAL